MDQSSDRVVRCLEDLLRLLEARTSHARGSLFVSPQQPLGLVSQCLGHLRRRSVAHLLQLALALDAEGGIPAIARANGWADELASLKSTFLREFRDVYRVRYFGGGEPVELGDVVSLRVLFRRREGRVSYLPGVSEPNPEIDFGGLCQVGISVPDFAFVQTLVDPDRLELKKNVVLVRRDPLAVPTPPSASELQAG